MLVLWGVIALLGGAMAADASAQDGSAIRALSHQTPDAAAWTVSHPNRDAVDPAFQTEPPASDRDVCEFNDDDDDDDRDSEGRPAQLLYITCGADANRAVFQRPPSLPLCSDSPWLRAP